MAKPQLRKPKKKVSPVKTIKVGAIDYKDTATLRKFISDRGKIRARRVANQVYLVVGRNNLKTLPNQLSLK